MVTCWRINCFLKVEKLKKLSFAGRKFVVESCSYSLYRNISTSFIIFPWLWHLLRSYSRVKIPRITRIFVFLRFSCVCCLQRCSNVRIAMLREVPVVCLFWYYQSYSWRQLGAVQIFCHQQERTHYPLNYCLFLVTPHPNLLHWKSLLLLGCTCHCRSWL